MNEIELKDYLDEVIEIEENKSVNLESNSENFNINDKINNLKIGVLGCGTIANIITDFAAKGKLNVDLDYFYDQEMEKAENIACLVDGMVVPNINDMLDHVDLVIEAASQNAVFKIVPKILKKGKDVIIISVSALMDIKLRSRLKRIAMENNSRIYIPLERL